MGGIIKEEIEMEIDKVVKYLKLMELVKELNEEGYMGERDWKYLRGCWKKFLDECEKIGVVK